MTPYERAEQSNLTHAATRHAFYEAIQWEMEHPGKFNHDRRAAEDAMFLRYQELFLQFHTALQEQNRFLRAEYARLRNITIEQLAVEIPLCEK